MSSFDKIFGNAPGPVQRPMSARFRVENTVPDAGIFADVQEAPAPRANVTKSSINGGIFGTEPEQAHSRSRPATPRDSGIFDTPSGGFPPSRAAQKDASRLDPSQCKVAGMKKPVVEPLRQRADPNRSCLDGGVFGAGANEPAKAVRNSNARNTSSFSF